MLIIPSISVMRGNAVVVPSGRMADVRVVNPNPTDLARSFYDRGARWIHIEDLDGGASGEIRNAQVLDEIRNLQGVKIQYSGGIKSAEDIETLIRQGASRVVMTAESLWEDDIASNLLKSYADVFVVEFAMRAGMIGGSTLEGGLVKAGIERAGELLGLGARQFLATDIPTRGALAGPNLPMVATWVQNFGAMVTIQGGISESKDLQILQETGCTKVVIGRALIEGRLQSHPLGD